MIDIFTLTFMPPKHPTRPAQQRRPGKPAAGRSKVRLPSLQEVYLRSCAEAGLHANSEFLSLLSDKPGEGFANLAIDLSRNYVGDKGIAPVLATIERGDGVQAIVLSNNGLRNHGIELLCASAARMPSLEYIDVSDNFISEGAAASLEKLLRVNRSIVGLSIDNTKIPVEWRIKLHDLVNSNSQQKIASSGAPTPAVEANAS